MPSSSSPLLLRALTTATWIFSSAAFEKTTDELEMVPPTHTTDDEVATFTLPSTAAALFAETFQGDTHHWTKSTDAMYKDQHIAFRTTSSSKGNYTQDKVMMLEDSHRHYGISAALPTPLTVTSTSESTPVVIQYEVTLTEGLECGGAYLKLLSANPDGSSSREVLTATSGYSIMFGPDKCGSTAKVHLILRHVNPVSGESEEKHLSNPPMPKHLDTLPHLYTLVLYQQTYTIYIDLTQVSTGSLLTDFSPAFQPAKMIVDDQDEKPSDWVDEADISDPEATKPDDWNDTAPQTIVDPSAVMPDDWQVETPAMLPDATATEPADWDTEDDGLWEAPLSVNPLCATLSGCGPWEAPRMPNPAFQGTWVAPMIPNPAYVSVWAPRDIPNPTYFELIEVSLAPIVAVAVEVWTTSGGLAFDNLWLGHSEAEALAFGKATWQVHYAIEDAGREKTAQDLPQVGGSWFDHLQLTVMRYVKMAQLGLSLRPLAGGAILFVLALLVLLFGWSFTGRSEEEKEKKEVEEDTNESETKTKVTHVSNTTSNSPDKVTKRKGQTVQEEQ